MRRVQCGVVWYVLEVWVLCPYPITPHTSYEPRPTGVASTENMGADKTSWGVEAHSGCQHTPLTLRPGSHLKTGIVYLGSQVRSVPLSHVCPEARVCR